MGEASGVEALVKRAFLFLEDGEWDKAKEYSERILDEDPENAVGYLVSLMADRQISKKEDLGNATVPLRDSKDFEKALRYGDAETAAFLQESDNAVLYQMAEKEMQSAKTEGQFLKAQRLFDSVGDFRDAAQKSAEAGGQALGARLQGAKNLAAKGKPEDTAKAIEILKGLEGYKDSDQLKSQYEDALAAQTKQAKSKRKKLIIVIVAVVAVIAVAIGVWAGVTNAKNGERAAAIEEKLAGMTFTGRDFDFSGVSGGSYDSLHYTTTTEYEFVFSSGNKAKMKQEISTEWDATGTFASRKPYDDSKYYSYDYEYKVEFSFGKAKVLLSATGNWQQANSCELELDENDNPVSLSYESLDSVVTCTPGY